MAISPALVSNITEKRLPRITEWQQRWPPATPGVFLDTIHDKVRANARFIHKAAYMVVGIELDGYKEVLGMWIGAYESATSRLTVLSELRSRGVQDVRVVVVDRLTGSSEAIATVFPKADVQQCVVHQTRNLLQYAARKDHAALTAALRPIDQAPTDDAGAAVLATLAAAWRDRYPTGGGAVLGGQRARTGSRLSVSRGVAAGHLPHQPHRRVPPAAAEGDQEQESVPGRRGADETAVSGGPRGEWKWTKRLPNWGEILGQLAIYFEDRLTPYLK